jgi:hypothetical protein
MSHARRRSQDVVRLELLLGGSFEMEVQEVEGVGLMQLG